MTGGRAAAPPLVIAVDGPSAAGKGTLGRRLAARFGLAFLDTGLLYRAVGLKLLDAGSSPSDTAAAERVAASVTLAELDDPELRREDVAQAASRVAAIPSVRRALLAAQRGFAAHPPAGPDGPAHGAVLDGRDIGTVVCPDATIKLFVTAGLATRARRRHKELLGLGRESIYARVLEDMTERDARDRERAVAPALPASDALVIDSSALDANAAFAVAEAHVLKCLRRRDGC